MRCMLLIPLLLIARIALAHDSEPALPFERIHSHDEIQGHLHAGWESHYFSEGRDNLDGGSLWITSIEAAWNHLDVGIWFAESPDVTYNELQFSVALTLSWDSLDAYLAYTHLRFPHDDSHDNEVGAGLSWSGLPLDLSLAADVYHSFEADGTFAELSLNWETELTK